MKIQSFSALVLGCVVLAGVAAPAGAQTTGVDTGLFRNVSFGAPSTSTKATAISFRATPAAPRRQSDAMSWNGIVLAGFSNASGVGFTVGGGAQASNFMGKENYGLQIDGLFSKVGGCDFCSGSFDYSAKLLSISGAFLYKFTETSSGWQPFAGGGLVFTRFSLDDDFGVCALFDCSSTGVGVQVQGGVSRGPLHLEGRVQGTSGGAFMGLVGYKFGGK